MAKFAGLNTQVLGISIDHVPTLIAWAESLGQISYPLLSDFWPHGRVARLYGVLREDVGYTERAIFLLDKDGIIRYIDIHDPDDQPSNQVLLDEIRRMDPEAAARELKEPLPERVELPHGGVVIYCTPWCPDCKQARAWLQASGIDYTEVNIHATPGAIEQVREWASGKQVTPTFDVDGQIVIGFDREKLQELLS